MKVKKLINLILRPIFAKELYKDGRTKEVSYRENTAESLVREDTNGSGFLVLS